MLCYLDFVEKQEFQKLRKLREAQANLPINNYRAKILELIQANPIVIVRYELLPHFKHQQYGFSLRLFASFLSLVATQASSTSAFSCFEI